MSSPIAAATCSGVLPLLPLFELWALGVGGAPLVVPRLPSVPVPSELARLRWSAASWLTVRLELSGLVREGSSSAGAPVAEALAAALVSEEATTRQERGAVGVSWRSMLAVAL